MAHVYFLRVYFGIFSVCSLYVHCMVNYIFTTCSLYVHIVFTMCLLYVHCMFSISLVAGVLMISDIIRYN